MVSGVEHIMTTESIHATSNFLSPSLLLNSPLSLSSSQSQMLLYHVLQALAWTPGTELKKYLQNIINTILIKTRHNIINIVISI